MTGDWTRGGCGEFRRTKRSNEKVGECKLPRCQRKQRRVMNTKTRGLGDSAGVQIEMQRSGGGRGPGDDELAW